MESKTYKKTYKNILKHIKKHTKTYKKIYKKIYNPSIGLQAYYINLLQCLDLTTYGSDRQKLQLYL